MFSVWPPQGSCLLWAVRPYKLFIGPSDLILASHAPGLSVVGTMDWSVPLGTLSALGARGTASVLVVEVDAHPGLNDHHTVVMPVPTVFICETERRMTQRLEVKLRKTSPCCLIVRSPT